MSYAILRLQKIKTFGAVSGVGNHNHRRTRSPHMDPSRVDDNREFIRSRLDIPDRIKKRLTGVKTRKDSVLACELLLTASPDYFDNPQRVEAWVDANLFYLRKTHGINLVSVSLHMDESTPHLHAVVVPLCPDGRLACKRYFGGPADFVAMQTDYAGQMGSVGLSRGLEGSSAHHVDVKRWRAAHSLDDALGPAVQKLLTPRPKFGR